MSSARQGKKASVSPIKIATKRCRDDTNLDFAYPSGILFTHFFETGQKIGELAAAAPLYIAETD